MRKKECVICGIKVIEHGEEGSRCRWCVVTAAYGYQYERGYESIMATI